MIKFTLAVLLLISPFNPGRSLTALDKIQGRVPPGPLPESVGCDVCVIRVDCGPSPEYQGVVCFDLKHLVINDQEEFIR